MIYEIYWLGWMDSNHRAAGIKILCLTTWRHPNMALRARLERATPRLTAECTTDCANEEYLDGVLGRV